MVVVELHGERHPAGIPRFESTFAALCESFVEGARFDPQEAELSALQRKLIAAQPKLVARLRADPEPMGDRLTAIVAQRLDVDPLSDMTANLIVRLVRSAARSAQGTWLTQVSMRHGASEQNLIELMREAFALVAGARVLDVVAELERTLAREGLG